MRDKNRRRAFLGSGFSPLAGPEIVEKPEVRQDSITSQETKTRGLEYSLAERETRIRVSLAKKEKIVNLAKKIRS